ncbi:molybdopterin-binding protein [Betaproteobacteria bacterium]|nr:molybdopterin-binding protein [Betaproteobacteria bacterium]
MCKRLKVCLVIIGDEILSGKRADKHFSNCRDLLAKRGLSTHAVLYIGDELESIEKTLRFCFLEDHIIFSFGGIGSTPDDLTRLACAKALGGELEPHQGAIKLITKRCLEMEIELTQSRLEMANLPQHASLIPNPISGFPGFSINHYHFLPGFPEMAYSMMEWVLDNNYSEYFQTFYEYDFSFKVSGIYESSISRFLESIKNEYPDFSIYSLPSLPTGKIDKSKVTLELGFKVGWETYNGLDTDDIINAAKNELKEEIERLGGKVVEELMQKR